MLAGKTGHTSHIKRIATDLLHRTHKLANGLGGIKGGDIRLPSMKEIGGIATIEGPIQIGGKGIIATAL